MRNTVLLVILLFAICSTDCKKKSEKKKTEEKHKIKNICDSDDNELAVPCFCTPSDINTAKEAVCWVYRMKISGDDAIWESFASQSNLEKLKFNVRPDGTLLDIPTNALKHLNQLQSLEIQYGFITNLTPFVFSNLTSISEISIPQNQISNLHSHAIANLPNLSSINLDGNKITELKKESIRDVPSLKMLYINNNNLSIIHDYAFGHLHRLEELEINSNQISVITKETFAGLKSLRYLDLRKNKLSMIGDNTFAALGNLYELLLDQNNIQYISEKGFSGLKKLTKLRISENQLKNLDGNVFTEATNVFLLDLRMNGLEMISFNTLQPLWDNLKNYTAHIWLEKNRLKCNCHLSWIHMLRNETENMELKLSLEELTCIPDEMEVENTSVSLITERPQDDQSYTVDPNSFQLDDEEVEYEEEITSSEYENEPGRPPRKKILDIPIEKLPCPEKQMATTETSIKSSVFHWLEASTLFNSSPSTRVSFELILSVCFARLLL